MKWVCREYYKGKWISNYFEDAKPAKKLMMKIIKRGGAAIALRGAF